MSCEIFATNCDTVKGQEWKLQNPCQLWILKNDIGDLRLLEKLMLLD